MNNYIDELGKKLHAVLDSGIDRLKAAKANVNDLQQETEASVQTRIDEAKQALEKKQKDVAEARLKIEEKFEEMKSETQSAVTQWKADRDLKKLKKRAERAEKYAEASIVVALSAAEEAEIAILEAAAARKDLEDAS